MANQIKTMTLSWWRTGVFPVLLLLAGLLASLYLLSSANENSALIGPYYGWLLLGNALGLVALAGLLSYQLYRLYVEYRQKIAGIRLTLRMVAMIVVLAVVPVSLVYLLSVQFLQRGIDSWFDVRIEAALEDSLELSRDALTKRIREKARVTFDIADKLKDKPTSFATLDLIDFKLSSTAEEISIIDTAGRIHAFSNIDSGILVPDMPSELVYSQLRRGQPYMDIEPIEGRGFYIRVIMPIPDTVNLLTGERRLLQTLYPVSARLNSLAQSVQSAFAAYKELSYIRDDLKYSFILTLSLALVLNILAAVVVAVMSARHLVEPVRVLVDGTRAVATGDYEKQLPVTSRDELGLLVRSFNDMTRRIAEASQLALSSQIAAEEERAYVKSVLSRLSSGVITLDASRHIVTMNPMAIDILYVDPQDTDSKTLEDLLEQYPHIVDFYQCLDRNLDTGNHEWQEQVTLMNRKGRQTLMVSGTLLSLEQGHEGERIIVFDDVTTFVQAQRNAAWGEMARRLAHEIKNPLTPIQLSAERVRHKCLADMPEGSAKILDTATRTIIDQVESMKDMVNAFTQYARSPELQLQPLSLNDLIAEVIEMYKGHVPQPSLQLQLEDSNPQIMADVGRMRQLLHNLVRNAYDALGSNDDACIEIETCLVDSGDRGAMKLIISDNGPGFTPAILDDAFEPYVTSKEGGTGLGLAIVKKIIEEHSGMIEVSNRDSGGASIVITLPVILPGPGDHEGRQADKG